MGSGPGCIEVEQPFSGSHAPAWEQVPTLQRHVKPGIGNTLHEPPTFEWGAGVDRVALGGATGRWSGRPAFPRRSVGTRELDSTEHAMKIVYYEDDDILHIEFSKGEIVRDESVDWNVNIGYTATGIGEITVLEAKKSGIYPLQIERVVADAA
jgi:uncharacterized protein YuzE